MSDLEQIEKTLGELGHRVKEIGDEIRTLVESESAESKARLDELRGEQKKIQDAVEPLLAEKEQAELKASVNDTQTKLEALLSQTRAASKAGQIGNRSFSSLPADYQAGSFLEAVATLGNPMEMPEHRVAAKATLESISTGYEKSWGKATLGTTDATGGWIVPNALVEEIIKPAQFQNFYRQIVTVVPGVTAYQVDQPWRSAAPSRMTVQTRGATKENLDLTYNGYTATMYTIARIYDVANQFLKQSRGAAERDVLQELAHAAALGERYYIVEGSGSSEPYGLQTAITNAPSTFVSSHSAATTLAGSISKAIATAAGALADRDRTPNAAVLKASTYWALASEGTNEAGFFFAPSNGPEGVRPGTLISPFGIPVFPDSQLTNTDDLIVGDFKALKVYFGDSFRIDSSSVAGTRWDENETGFRGEMEIGLDARPAVYAGAFQRVDDVVA